MRAIAFARIHEDVKLPIKREEDAGYDIYAYFPEKEREIGAGEVALMPTGIYSKFPKYLVGVLKERGSTGTKGIAQRSGVIDSSYRGEWLIPLQNNTGKKIVLSKLVSQVVSTEDVLYYPYDKAITQVVFLHLAQEDIVEVPLTEVTGDSTHRGDGKLGSSGK